MTFGRAPALLLVTLVACGAPPPEAPELRTSLPTTDAPLDAVARRHGRLRERMEARGYSQRGAPARLFVLEGPGEVLPLDLDTGVCSTFVALGAGGVRELSMWLFDGEGVEVARDAVAGEGALVHVCPPPSDGAHAAFYLVIGSAEGGGGVALGEFRSALGEGDGFEGLFDGLLAPRAPFDAVEGHLAAARAALRGRGLEPLQAARISWVAESAALRDAVTLSVGRCYVATARGGEGVRDVDLFLFDASGAEVGRDLSEGSEANLEYCPVDAGAYWVEARAFEGQGGIGIQVLVGAGATGDPSVSVETALEPARYARPDETPEVALSVVAASLTRLGFEQAVYSARDASIAPGEVRTHDVVIGPGCSLVIATGSHEGMDVDLYLADPNGRQVDEDTAVQASARVRACRESATVMRVAVKAYGRSGTYALAILRAPRAISEVRDLRIEEALARWRQSGWVTTRRETLRLDEGVTHAIEVQVDAGECMAVGAAGGDDVRDVDLFLRDVDGRVLVSDSGPSASAALSRCAQEAALFRIETVAYEGGGEILLEVVEGTPAAAIAEDGPSDTPRDGSHPAPRDDAPRVTTPPRDDAPRVTTPPRDDAPRVATPPRAP